MKQIVIADDDDALRSTLQRLLERRGYLVRTAADGGAALRLIEERVPDLLISDIIMPTYEGMELLLTMRERFAKVKILMISGGGRIDSKDYLSMASKLGASSTLAKPFIDQELFEAVEGLCGPVAAA